MVHKIVESTSDPAVTDDSLNLSVRKGTRWHNTTSGDIFLCTDPAPAKAVWVLSAIVDDLATAAGIGITGTADNFASGVEKIGTIFKTTIVIDIDGLNSGGTARDVIGADGLGVAHLGQITAARNGTIFAGLLSCIEAPTTGDNDIDLYSAVEATGVENTLITALDETQLCNSGDLTAASRIPLTVYPAANEYLYLVGVQGDAEATYASGILILELWGK